MYELTIERFSASTGTNFFRLWENAEYAGDVEIMSRYEGDGTQVKVWEHTLGVFDEVLGRD